MQTSLVGSKYGEIAFRIELTEYRIGVYGNVDG